MDTSDFWGRIKSRLRAKGMTYENAAKLCGFNFYTFRGWITRNIVPPSEELFRLARLLNVSMEFLLTGEPPDTAAALDKTLDSVKTLYRQLETLRYQYRNDEKTPKKRQNSPLK